MVQTATVTAAAVDFSNGAGAIVIRDNELEHFDWDAIGTPQTAEMAFSTTVRAKNIDNETILVYTGAATLSGAGNKGSVPLTPANCTFANGAWTGNVIVNAVDSNVLLTANDGLGHSGASNSFDVTHGPLDHFVFSSIASPQYQDTPFTIIVTAVDANGYTFDDFNGSLNLSGRVDGGGPTTEEVLSFVKYADMGRFWRIC